MEPSPLIVVGASTRGAAWSALRAGFTPWCIDLFADVDLRAVANVQPCPVEDWPDGVESYFTSAPHAPWCYTGAFENHPELVGRLAKRRPLWGNQGEALQRSRCPFTIAELLRAADLPSPQVRTIHPTMPTLETGKLLRKPIRSSAGMGIQIAVDHPREADDAHYLQEFVPGIPMSAAFAALGESIHLLGVTEQLIGEPWLHASGFRYCGNIGPVPVSSTLRETLIRIGRILATGCGLRGLFGIDFILQDDVPWVLEVNPRYTASMELLEFSGSTPLLALQRAEFEGTSAEYQIPPVWSPGMLGKAILYAPRTAIVRVQVNPPTVALQVAPLLADIPHHGDTIQAGWPVVTIFALGCDVESCRAALVVRAAETYARLFPFAG